MPTLNEYSDVIDAAAELIEAINIMGYIDGEFEDIIRGTVTSIPRYMEVEDYDLLDDAALSYLLQPLE